VILHRRDLEALALRILLSLATPTEIDAEPFAMTVEAADDATEGSHGFLVKLASRPPSDIGVRVSVSTTEEYFAASVAFAAKAIADAFQLEVIESLGGAARPSCEGHAHPMQAAADQHGAWWECPRDSSRCRRIWPLTHD